MAILNKSKKSWLNTDHDDVPKVNSFQPSNDQLCNTPSLQGLRPPSPKKFEIWNSLGHDFQNFKPHIGVESFQKYFCSVFEHNTQSSQCKMVW